MNKGIIYFFIYISSNFLKKPFGVSIYHISPNDVIDFNTRKNVQVYICTDDSIFGEMHKSTNFFFHILLINNSFNS